MKINKELMKQAMEQTKKQNALEDKIAKELFGCSYDELDDDDKDYVQCEAMDRM